MSNSIKSNRKVISQHELRRIMNEQKNKLPKTVKKIESPLAKYTDTGELRCILCDSAVRGDALWSAHVASREHLANIAAAKRSREKMLAPPAVKRSLPPLPPPPAKKPKSILKNSTASSAGVPSDFFDSVKSEVKTEPVSKVKVEPLAEQVMEDRGVASSSQSEGMEVTEDEAAAATSNSDTLPEGFFDDPKLDAKVRNVEYRDPIEEEWEKFQRAMKEESAQSHQLIQEEQEEATAERQLEEIDEQMRNWSKVIELERRKDLVAMETREMEVEGSWAQQDDEEGEASNEEAEFDEFLDWRAKQS